MVVVVVSVSARTRGDVQRDERGVLRVVEEDAEGRADGVEGVQGRERASERGEEDAGVDAYGKTRERLTGGGRGRARRGGGIRGGAADGARDASATRAARRRRAARGRRGMSTGMYTCVRSCRRRVKARTRPLEVASSGGRRRDAGVSGREARETPRGTRGSRRCRNREEHPSARRWCGARDHARRPPRATRSEGRGAPAGARRSRATSH